MRSFQNNQSINRSTVGLLKITKSVIYNHLGYHFSLHTNKIGTETSDPIYVRTRFDVHLKKKNSPLLICYRLLINFFRVPVIRKQKRQERIEHTMTSNWNFCGVICSMRSILFFFFIQFYNDLYGCNRLHKNKIGEKKRRRRQWQW